MNNYNIDNIAKKINISYDSLIHYGDDKAKIDISKLPKLQRKGKLILTTAMTPTKAGEGKTTTSIGLSDALSLINKNVIACLREPSLGPVFGVKGGGAGGGEATLYPEEDINLHFTGDIHAITSINNLIAALLDNELYQKNIDIDPETIIFPRCIDNNDRGLRNILTNMDDNKIQPYKSSFVITAASEIMAIFCLSKNLDEFLDRIENVTLAKTKLGNVITVKDLKCRGAIRKLIKYAIHPNLVQTKYHTPAIVHGGPFANIAHGCNSIIATDLSLKLADYVVTEAGFGSDLGMEKFLDIVCPLLNISPSLIVMVASIRALKLHGGVNFSDLNKENVEAVKIGYANLKKNLSNVSLYHLNSLVSINKFSSDTENEIHTLQSLLEKDNFEYALNSSFMDGPIGAKELAQKAFALCENDESKFSPLTNQKNTLKQNIEIISKKIYGADNVLYENGTDKLIDEYQNKYPDFNICMSKVPTSLSDDPLKLNVPKHDIHIKNVRLFTGAKFVVPLTGNIFTMPGLPKVPASKGMN